MSPRTRSDQPHTNGKGPPPPPPPKMRIDETLVALARARKPKPSAPKDLAFRLPEHPPGVKPGKGAGLAMDEAPGTSDALAWATGQALASSFAEGIGFLGYTYLAELAQRPEYRVITETIAEEMTRKWITIQAASGNEDKGERIKELGKAVDDLAVREIFRQAAVGDGFFGRSHIYLDTGDTNERDELMLPIGNGRDKMSRSKVGPKKPLIAVRTVEAMWVYPTSYNSTDPLAEQWYRPELWYVMGKPIHRTRLLTMVGREVPDILKPAYSFGGLSMSQMAKPYVDNWLRTRQSVADLIHSFTVFALSTDMSQLLRQDGDQLFRRMELFTQLRDNSGLFLRDKNTEEFDNISAPLGTLDALQAASQEHMASVSRIPIVKLLGIQPAGLNASSEGEIRTFYDTILAHQERLFRPKLGAIIDFIMLSLWGEIDEAITFKFNPLWTLDEAGEAGVRKTNAETAQIHIEAGVISQEEERARIARDPSTPYEGLDPTDMPELEQEQEEGLVIPGAKPEIQEADEPDGGAKKKPPDDKQKPDSDKQNAQAVKTERKEDDTEEGAQDRILPFDAAFDSEWSESDHPRGQPGNAGQFGSGGGSSGGSSEPSAKELKKASKGTKVIPSGVKGASKLEAAFNERWAGRELTDKKEIAEKIADFKTLKSGIDKLKGGDPNGAEYFEKNWHKSGSVGGYNQPSKETVKKYESAYENQEAPSAEAPAAGAPPLKESELKRVGKQMGSNPGGVFETKDGDRFYIKQGRSKEHVDTELAAADLYALAGSPTLEYRPVEGGKHIATQMAKLDKNDAGKLDDKERKQAQEDFVTHAWLANWDAVGMGGDNLGTIGGVPTALDLGGALTFRAQGAPKGGAFGDKVGELETLRSKQMNPDSAKVYGDISPETLKRSAAKVTSIPNAKIKAVVAGRNLAPALADKLIARKQDIAQRFGLKAADAGEFREADHPRRDDGKFGAGGGSAGAGPGAKGGGTSHEEIKKQVEQHAKPETLLQSIFSIGSKGWEKREAARRIKAARINNLSPDLGAHIVGYVGRRYKKLNNDLRSGNVSKSQEEYAKKLNEALDTFVPYRGTTMRGVELTPEQRAMYTPGAVIEERGFMSTGKGFALNANTKFVINGKTGRDISKLTSDTRDTQWGEVLFKSGSRFKVVRNDGRIIELTEVDDEPQKGAKDDASWTEGDHPRRSDGKFGSGGGGASEKTEGASEQTKAKVREFFSAAKVKQAVASGLSLIKENKRDIIATGIIAAVTKAAGSYISPELEDHIRHEVVNLVENAGVAKQVALEAMRKTIKGLVDLRKGAGAKDAASDDDDEDDIAPALEAVLKIIDGMIEHQAEDEAPFNEGDHPRSPDGKFTSGGGGGGASGGGPAVGNEIKEEKKKVKPPPGFKTHNAYVGHLLKNGVTTKEVLAATGWPSVSMPNQAKMLGVDLVKKTENGVTKYYSVEKKPDQTPAIQPPQATSPSATLAHIEKMLDTPPPPAPEPAPEPEPPPPPPPPPKPMYQTPTPQEAKVAAKGTPLIPSHVPGALSLEKAFNDKWQGKNLTDPDQIAEKVHDYKQLKGKLQDLNAASAAQKAAAQKAEAEKQAAKLKAEQEEANKQLPAIMKELGLHEMNEAEAVKGIAKMTGESVGNLVTQMKKWEQGAKNSGVPELNPFEYASLQSYIGSGYLTINPALRAQSWTPEMHAAARVLNSALKKMPAYTDKGVLSRGSQLPVEIQASYIPGKIITERAFTSTSTEEGFSHKNTIFKITKPKTARDVRKLNPGEGEVLFPAMTPFKVLKNYKQGNKTVIEMEEVVGL